MPNRVISIVAVLSVSVSSSHASSCRHWGKMVTDGLRLLNNTIQYGINTDIDLFLFITVRYGTKTKTTTTTINIASKPVHESFTSQIPSLTYWRFTIQCYNASRIGPSIFHFYIQYIFEYQHFRCIKSHHAKPPRIGLRYLPQNTKSTMFRPSILYVSDTLPRLQTVCHSTPQRAENWSVHLECLRHLPQHFHRLPSKP